MSHWCKDIPRDEAVRAAEDGRQGPLPTLEECIELQKQLQSARPGGGTDPAPSGGEPGGSANGLRTERVTLEVTHDDDDGHIRLRDWDDMLFSEDRNGIRFPGESVRVVEECCLDRISMGEVIRERDAAIRERDAAKQRADFESVKCSVLEDDVIRLRTRVAELEAAPPASGATNSPADPKSLSPVAWGVFGRGIIRATSTSRSDAVDMQSEHVCDTAVVPLYAAPPPAKGWLTEEEREAVAFAAKKLYELSNRQYVNGDQDAARDTVREEGFLHSFLARSSPPEVVLPPFKGEVTGGLWAVAGYNSAIKACRAALAAAGVKVKEVGRE